MAPELSAIWAPEYPHLLRHTMATRILAEGMDITDIQKFLGHEDIGATRIYAETSVAMLRRKFDRVTGAEGHDKALGQFIDGDTGAPVFVHRARSLVDDDGATIQRLRLYDPTGDRLLTRAEFEAGPWRPAERDAFAHAWGTAAAAAPHERVSRFWMATGLLLPVWKHLPVESQKIWRAICDDGTPVLGRVLSDADAGRFRAALAPTEVIDAH